MAHIQGEFKMSIILFWLVVMLLVYAVFVLPVVYKVIGSFLLVILLIIHFVNHHVNHHHSKVPCHFNGPGDYDT